MFLNNRKKLSAAVLLAFLLLSGCSFSKKPAGLRSGGPAAGANCDNLKEKRKEAVDNHAAAIKASEAEWIKTRDAAGEELKQCLAAAGKNMPCDQEWQSVQAAYGLALGDISNQAAYDIYKQAKKGWDECFKNIDKKGDENAEQFKKGEGRCQSDFQAKIEAGRKKFDQDAAAAKIAKEEALKALAEIEKQCKEKQASPKPEQPKEPKENTPKQPAPGPEKPVVERATGDNPCEPAVPGADARPRTGQASDFGPQDIVINLITQVAEDVTGAAIPTSALSDQIFAVAVVAKITTRIAQITLEIMEADSQSRYGRVRLLERKLQKYKDALDVWGKIAQGRPPLDVKERAAELSRDNSVFCPTAIETTGTLEIKRGR